MVLAGIIVLSITGCPAPVQQQMATAMKFEVTPDGEVLINGNLFGKGGLPEGEGLSARMQQAIRSINFEFYYEGEGGNREWFGYANIAVDEAGNTNGTAGLPHPNGKPTQ